MILKPELGQYSLLSAKLKVQMIWITRSIVGGFRIWFWSDYTLTTAWITLWTALFPMVSSDVGISTPNSNDPIRATRSSFLKQARSINPASFILESSTGYFLSSLNFFNDLRPQKSTLIGNFLLFSNLSISVSK